jgi:GDP-L-fucose synthase
MTRRRLLITGGGGMVGRNLLAHPGLDRWEVEAPTRAELDLQDGAATAAYIAALAPDTIVHAAGRVGGIQANIAHPVAFLVENLDMGRNLIMGAYRAGVPHLLNLGSACMYPRGHADALVEEDILTGTLEPTNEGYALAKLAAARLCQYIRHERPQLQYKTLIPCNLYGRFDSFAPDRSHLVAAAITKLHAAKREGRDVVEIWGDGTARREFLYCGDLADAIVRAIDDISALPDLLNIGVGDDHSIDDYYAVAARVVGWDGRFAHDRSRPVGMARKLLDIGRQRQWGWQAPTTLEQGIALTYRHYREAAA